MFRKMKKQCFVYAAFPKSAPNYLIALLEKVCGNDIKVITPKISSGFGHNFISEENLFGYHPLRPFRYLTLYGHFPYNKHNSIAIKKLTNYPKIIVTTRPLADIVVSYKNHVDKFHTGALDHRIDGLTESFSRWGSLADSKKFDYIINFALPWYIKFILGLQEASLHWPVEFISFQEHTLEPAACVSNILRYLTLKTELKIIGSLRAKENIPKRNFNVGLQGRGFCSA